MKSRDLSIAMMWALAARTPDDLRQIEALGISSIDVGMVGVAQVSHVVGTNLYALDPNGDWVYLTPVRVSADSPHFPESRDPQVDCRNGEFVDIVAWHPGNPSKWWLRAGLANWIGCCSPQYLDPPAVTIRSSLLSWLQAGCDGIVLLNRDPLAMFSLIKGFRGGIVVEDELQRARLRRELARRWSVPPIAVIGEGGR